MSLPSETKRRRLSDRPALCFLIGYLMMIGMFLLVTMPAYEAVMHGYISHHQKPVSFNQSPVLYSLKVGLSSIASLVIFFVLVKMTLLGTKYLKRRRDHRSGNLRP